MNAGWRSRRGGMAAAGARYSRPAHLIAPTNEGIDMLGFGLDRPRHEDRDDAASAPRSGGSRSGPSPPGPPRDPVPRAGDSAGASRQDLDAESFATARSDGLAGPAHVAGPPSRAMDDGDSHSARHAYGDGSADLTDAQSQSRSGSHRRASTLRVGSLQEATMPRPPHMRPLPRREDYNRALMQATTTSFVQSREDAATHRPGAADSTEFSRVSYSTVGHPPARSRARRGGASPGLQLESSAEEGSSGSDEVSRVRMEDEERGSGEVTVNADTASGARTPAKGSPPATASVDSKALGWDHAGSRQGGRVDAWLRWLVGRGKSEPAFAEACGSRVGASAAGSRAADGTVMMPPPAKTKSAVAFRPGIIDPRSQWLRNWELVGLLVLVYTATVTPYEVAFFQPAFNTLFLVNRLVDFTFFVDLVMHFFTAVPGDPTMSVMWVQDYPTIARRYLKSWFMVDFVSVIPYDLIALMMQSDELQQLQALRTLRLLRLAKLFRVLRAVRIFRQWESSININYAIVGLFQFALLMAMSSHWLACLWRLTAELHDNPWESWLAHDNLIDGSRGDQYAASVYWAVMTLSTIGYGDIAANTTLERGVATVSMLVGSSIWAYIVGSICSVVSSLDAQTLQFRRTMDELNFFMKDEHLPKEMRQRLREYFHQRRALTKALSYQNLLVQMSPSLRQEVAFHINRRWLRHVTWFQRASKDFVSAVAVHLVPAVYAPKELVHGDEFSIVVRGVAAKEGKILTQGDTWGDDIILASSEFRRATPARALTYLEVKSMSQEDLATVLDAFPEEALRIRKIANRLLLRRAFIREAQRRKTLRKEEARLRLGRRPPRSPAGSDGGGGSGSGGGGDVKGGVTAHHTPDAEDESKSVDVARTASAGGEEGGVGGDEARRGIRPTPGPALVPRVAPAWVQGKDRPTQGKPPESTVVAGSAPSSASPAGGPPAAAHSAPAPAPTSTAVLAPGSPAAPAPAPPAERGAAAASAGSAATREDAESRVDDLGVPFGSLVPVVVQTDRSGRESTVLPHRLGEGRPARHQLGTGTDSPASGPLAASVRADVSAAVSAELQVLRSELRTALATIAAATQQAQRDAGRPAPPVAPMSTQTSTQTRQAPRQRTDPAEKEGGERQREHHRAEAPSEAQASGPRPAAARRSRRQRGQLARQGSVFAWEMEGRRQRAAPLRGLGVEGEAPSGGDRQGVRIRPPPSARDLSKYDSMHLLGRR